MRQVPSDDEEADHRPRQRRNRDDDSDGEAAGGGAMDVDAPEGSDVQMAKKLVRYALSCEYSRTVLRRDGIKDKGSLALPSCFLERAYLNCHSAREPRPRV